MGIKEILQLLFEESPKDYSEFIVIDAQYYYKSTLKLGMYSKLYKAINAPLRVIEKVAI